MRGAADAHYYTARTLLTAAAKAQRQPEEGELNLAEGSLREALALEPSNPLFVEQLGRTHELRALLWKPGHPAAREPLRRALAQYRSAALMRTGSPFVWTGIAGSGCRCRRRQCAWSRRKPRPSMPERTTWAQGVSSPSQPEGGAALGPGADGDRAGDDALAATPRSSPACWWQAQSGCCCRGIDPLARGVAFGVVMGVTALGIHSTVDFNPQIPANAFIFVILLALGWVSLFLKRDEHAA